MIFLSVLISGNKLLAKLSSDDKYLLPALVKFLLVFEPALENRIQFSEGKISGFDAVIATGVIRAQPILNSIFFISSYFQIKQDLISCT